MASGISVETSKCDSHCVTHNLRHSIRDTLLETFFWKALKSLSSKEPLFKRISSADSNGFQRLTGAYDKRALAG